MKINARWARINPTLGKTRLSYRLIATSSALVLALIIFFFALVGLRGEHDWTTVRQADSADARTNQHPLKTPPEEWSRRATEIKKAFLHAYSGYERHAFPHDELLPQSGGKRDNFNGWGVTIFDSLDTMMIMGLHEEFSRALTHIEQVNFTIRRDLVSSSMNTELSFFETVIRYLGGMLSGYAMSHELVLLTKAAELADALDPVFDTVTGLPWFGFKLPSGNIKTDATGMLAEVGSFQLEYASLAWLTGNKSYYDRVAKLFDVFEKINFTDVGMLPTKFNLFSGRPFDHSVTVAAGADSGHEYLLKYYLMTGQKDLSSLHLYMNTVNHILTNLTYLSPHRSLLYTTNIIGTDPAYRFEHLSCFLPGLLALGVHTLPPSAFVDAEKRYTPFQEALLSSHNLKELHIQAAIGLGESCWLMYADQPTGLGPEAVIMNKPIEGPETGLWIHAMTDWKKGGSKGIPPGLHEKTPAHDISARDYQMAAPVYLLRPETIESMYLLWKVTGEERWRDRGWAIFQALEKHTRCQSGYSTLTTVEFAGSGLGDSMPSYFLAESLKYLYLLFIDEDPFPLNKWVFNTEAHPLPIFDWPTWEKHKFGVV